jgi:hypothetical protein
MRTLLTLCIVSTLACNSSCGGAQAIERQTVPAAACLPVAAAAILACVKAHDESCVIVSVAELVACWSTHQPAPATPDAAPLPAVGVRTSYDEDDPSDGSAAVVALSARVSTPSPFPGGAPTLADVAVAVHIDITADAPSPVPGDAQDGFAALWSEVVTSARLPLAQRLGPPTAFKPNWHARSVASCVPSAAPAMNALTATPCSTRSLYASPLVRICPYDVPTMSIASSDARALVRAMSSATSRAISARFKSASVQSMRGTPGGGPLGCGTPGSGNWSDAL